MLKIEVIDHEHAVATGDSSMLCLWRGQTTHQAVIELHSISASLAKRTPNKVGHLTVVEQGAAMPSSVVRDELAKVLRGVATSVACSALVFEGGGFLAATVRAITTTLNQVARQPYPHRVFATVDEATAWMGSLSPQLKQDHLQNEMLQLRRALDLQTESSAS